MKRMLVVVISFVIIGGSGLTTGQDSQAEQKARIEQHITSLGTRYWDKAVEELVRIGEPAVGPLIAALRPEVQLISARACLALARIGTSRAVDAVFKALDEGSSGVRSEAAGALRYIRSDRAVERLHRACRQRRRLSGPDVRRRRIGNDGFGEEHRCSCCCAQ